VIPGVGASGAIAGVLAAYLLCFPRARVFVGIPLLIYMEVITLPAVIVLGFWFVVQLFSGVAMIGLSSEATMGGVAWWAHIGGFVAGLILTPFLRQRRRREFRYLDVLDSRYSRRNRMCLVQYPSLASGSEEYSSPGVAESLAIC